MGILIKMNKWFSVNEILPKELSGVLVYCPTDDNVFSAYLEKGEWYVFSPEGREKIKCKISMWRMMPVPQKDNEESKKPLINYYDKCRKHGGAKTILEALQLGIEALENEK